MSSALEPVAEQLVISLAPLKLTARRWRPRDAVSHTIVALHGMMSHAGWFERLGWALARRGIALVALDRRGSGNSRKLYSDADSFEVHVDDVCRALESAAIKGSPVLLGWCWGAQTAVVAASRASDKCQRLILAAPGLTVSTKVAERTRESFASGGDPLPLPFDETEFSGDPEARRFIAADPLAWRQMPRAFVDLTYQVRAAAIAALPSIRQPTLAILAASDQVTDNQQLRVLLDRFDLIELPGEHALVLEVPDQIAEQIHRWLNS